DDRERVIHVISAGGLEHLERPSVEPVAQTVRCEGSRRDRERRVHGPEGDPTGAWLWHGATLRRADAAGHADGAGLDRDHRAIGSRRGAAPSTWASAASSAVTSSAPNSSPSASRVMRYSDGPSTWAHEYS